MSEPTEADYEWADKHAACTLTIGDLRTGLANAHAAGRAAAGIADVNLQADSLTEALVENDRLNRELSALKQHLEGSERSLTETSHLAAKYHYEAHQLKQQLAGKGERCKEWESEVMKLKCRLADAQAKAVAAGSIVYEPDGEIYKRRVV